MSPAAKPETPDPIQVPTRAPVRSITAAARKIDPRSKADVATISRKPQEWQTEAWIDFHEVPELTNVALWVGSNLSRLRYYPAVQVDPDQGPIPIDDAVGIEGGVDQEIADLATDALARITEGPTDGMAGHLNSWGICLTVSGDSYLVADDDPETGEEGWHVYSEAAVVRRGSEIAIKDTPNGKARPLGPDALMYRIWRRDQRWPGLAYSNVRPLLATMEEMLIYDRQFRAIGRSRNVSGILFLSNKLDLPKPQGNPSGQQQLTTLEAGITESMVTPTFDDGSAAAVVPHMVRGDGKPDELIKYFPIDRKIDDQAIARMTYLINRFGNGMNAPVQVVIGVSDLNHWNVWAVQDEAYRAYLEPMAQVPATGLASAYLRPSITESLTGEAGALDENRRDMVKRVVIGIDSANLVVRPNRSADAKDAFDRLAISWEAYRSYLAIPDSDKPSDEEIAARAIMGLGDFRRSGLAQPGETVPGLPAGGDSATGGGDGQASAIHIGRLLGLLPPRERIALGVTAGAGALTLGEQLGVIEIRCRDRLQVMASEEMNSVLRVAGSRLRSRMQGSPELARAARTARDLHGLDLIRRFGDLAAADVPGLIDGSFQDLQPRWDATVAAAQADVARLLRRYAPTDDQGDMAVDFYERNQTDNRRDGWALLASLLLTLTTDRILTPDGTPDRGEFDPTMSVPAGVIRQALARAGGSASPSARPTDAILDSGMAGGIATGPDTVGALAVIDVQVDSYRWVVGGPARPFEPHADLEGAELSGFDDEQLAYDGWPASDGDGFLWPGDHDGCQCVMFPITTQTSGEG